MTKPLMVARTDTDESGKSKTTVTFESDTLEDAKIIVRKINNILQGAKYREVKTIKQLLAEGWEMSFEERPDCLRVRVFNVDKSKVYKFSLDYRGPINEAFEQLWDTKVIL